MYNTRTDGFTEEKVFQRAQDDMAGPYESERLKNSSTAENTLLSLNNTPQNQRGS